MLSAIKSLIEKIDLSSREKPIRIISHYDTDGITSAAIFSRALNRWQKSFSLEIVKGLEEAFILNLPEDKTIIFLDLASSSLHVLKEKKTNVFILDHHEIPKEFHNAIPSNVQIINPHLFKEENISSAAICYLFAKTLNLENKDLASLAVIGMIGDVLEKNLGKIYQEILTDAETTLKKGLLLYPSTRPLDKTLEYCDNPYIPGVTGSFQGCQDILREAKIPKINNKYKALYELTEEEMSNLITAIMLKLPNSSDLHDMIGNIFLTKFFNKLEDARELSALINACSRMGHPYISLGFCLGNKAFKDDAEKIYIDYKQHLVSALRYVSETEKISGKMYTIINAKDKIKDTIIGTVASIISHSPIYEEGTIIVALAYNGDKIKVSARIAGKEGRNVREVLNQAVIPLGGEVGGHHKAAGCLISKEKEEDFLSELRKVLEVELVKV